jgi:hypothetical protein
MAMSVKDGLNGVSALFNGGKVEREKWDGRSPDPSLEMFRAAYYLACQMGLSSDRMPDLRTENGVLHAYRPNGSKIPLTYSIGWAEQSGYAELLRELKGRSVECY